MTTRTREEILTDAIMLKLENLLNFNKDQWHACKEDIAQVLADANVNDAFTALDCVTMNFVQGG